MMYVMMLLAICTKVGYFYLSTDIPIGKLPYAMVTISVLLMLLFVLHSKRKFYLLISSIVTLIMYGDILYYRYFKDFLSVELVSQATFVGSVTNIILSMLSLFDLVLIFDLICYALFTKQNSKFRLYKRKSFLVFNILLMPVIIVSISSGEVYTGIKQYEFFNYHVYDIVQADLEDDTLYSQDIDDIVSKLKTNNDLGTSGELYGVASGKRLILVQLESFQNDYLNKTYHGVEITPHLNKLLVEDTIHFDHYYQQLGKGNTSDAEFVSLNSLYPVTSGNAYNIYEKNDFYGMPWILREHGYTAHSYHGFEPSFWNRENIYPSIGFESSKFDRDYVMGTPIGFGLNDMDFFSQTLDYIEDLPAQSFHFLVSLTSHKPYVIPAEEKLLPVVMGEDDLFENYLQSLAYTDRAIGVFLEGLKLKGLYDDSIIVFYGDHYGIGIEQEEAILSVETFFEKPYTSEDMLNVPLIVHIPGLGQTKTVSTTGGHIDLLPTLLNLMGIQNQYVTFGRDLINSPEGFVASQTFMNKGSFITNDVVYDIGRNPDGSEAQAYQRDTHEPLEVSPFLAYSEYAIQWINFSKKITESDDLMLIMKLVQTEKLDQMHE